MTKDDFKQKRNKGLEELFNEIIDTFKKLDPVAIHQFGSGAKGNMDEFSDLDLWFTFEDNQIGETIKDRFKIFENIAPILVKHESAKNSPLGGRYSLVIHETKYGLFHVDYYFSKKSNTVIRTDAKFLYGDDSLPRGEWVMDREAIEPDSLEIQLDSITFMTYIAVKGVIRKWPEPTFTNFVKHIYKDIESLSNQKLTPLPEKLSFEFVYAVFDNVYHLATEKQQKAINKIRKYAAGVEELYT